MSLRVASPAHSHRRATPRRTALNSVYSQPLIRQWADASVRSSATWTELVPGLRHGRCPQNNSANFATKAMGGVPADLFARPWE